jgi:hypothetical protein
MIIGIGCTNTVDTNIKLLVSADLIQMTSIGSEQIKKIKFKTCTVFKTYTCFKLISQYLKLIFTISQQYLKLISQYLNNITIFTTFTITSQQFNSVEQYKVDHQFNNQIVNIHKHYFLVHQLCLNTKSFIIAELRKLCWCVVLVEEVSLWMEYFTAQEHA